MAAEQVRVGILGAGRIGRIHAQNAAVGVEGAVLTAVADPRPERAQELGTRWGVQSFADPLGLIRSAAVDAVVICTPTDTHAELAIEAAAAGKHILCEKPIALDLASIDRVAEVVSRAGITFQVGFNRRFDANFRRVKELVTGGAIGEPHTLHIISRDPAPPTPEYVRTSGGLFLDMTIHDFDMACFLLESDVVEVYATGEARIDPFIAALGDIDTALIVLKFDDGTIATIENSRRAVYGYDQRVEVFGSGGSVRTSNRHPNDVEISVEDHVRRDVPLHFFLERYRESFAAELQAFITAIADGKPAPVGAAEGRVPVELALAAAQSLKENRPVSLGQAEVV